MYQLSHATEFRHKFSTRNRLARIVWSIAYCFLVRPFGFRCFRKWRVLILRLFGAEIAWNSTIHASARIWAPWNLTVGQYSCVGPEVDCYNQGQIVIGNGVTISQKSYLCASSHDHNDPCHPLVLAPISIGDRAWIAADAFIGPGVHVSEGAVVGARAAVFRDVEAWSVVGGNPAKLLKQRVVPDSPSDSNHLSKRAAVSEAAKRNLAS